MSVSRRDCLIAAGLASTAGVAGCARVSTVVRRNINRKHLAPPSHPVTPDVRLLNRAGFGPTTQDLTDLAEDGHDKWVSKRLSDEIPEDPLLLAVLGSIDVEAMDGMEMRDFPLEAMLTQLQQVAILRARYGRNQVKERLVDFWTNHFNIYGRKGLAAYRKPRDEHEVIRKHALGYFPEMLMASAKSPAMLGYLDNRLSDKDHPNENYAREIMELHSLGVRSGYTQQDIKEVARCFTGWTVEDRFMHRRGEFRYESKWHDMGEKVVLGHKIRPGDHFVDRAEATGLHGLFAREGSTDESLVGLNEGEEVVRILGEHERTAHFIATKLCRYFLHDRADEWITRTTQTYLDTKGHIPSMLQPMLTSAALQESAPKIKRPFDFLVSSLRVTETQTDGGRELVNALRDMGEPLYQWPMPDGYPDRTQSWASGLLPRWNFAIRLAQGGFRDAGVDYQSLGGDPIRTAGMILRRPILVNDPYIAALRDLPPNFAIAAMLASPEFQWR